MDNLEFRDTCYSIHCNQFCPDKLDFSSIKGELDYDWVKISVIVVVVSITVFSIIVKVSLFNMTYNSTNSDVIWEGKYMKRKRDGWWEFVRRCLYCIFIVTNEIYMY